MGCSDGLSFCDLLAIQRKVKSSNVYISDRLLLVKNIVKSISCLPLPVLHKVFPDCHRREQKSNWIFLLEHQAITKKQVASIYESYLNDVSNE